MPTLTPSPLLRQALLADAATSAACGLLMLATAGPLSGLLGLPVELLRIAGAILLPFAAFIAYLALRQQLARPVVWGVILVNVLWAADSVLLLAGGWLAPTRAGYAFVIAQALAVLMYADLQYRGIRRSSAVAA